MRPTTTILLTVVAMFAAACGGEEISLVESTGTMSSSSEIAQDGKADNPHEEGGGEVEYEGPDFGEVEKEEREIDPNAPCLGQLDSLGVSFTVLDDPGCAVDQAVSFAGALNGVTYLGADGSPEVQMSCETALNLYGFGEYLAAQGINEVVHNGSLICGAVDGHGSGAALDILMMRGSGSEYSVADHWETGDSPETLEGQVLYMLAHQAAESGLFNEVLTPNSDSHGDRLHLEIGSGASSIDGGGVCNGHD